MTDAEQRAEHFRRAEDSSKLEGMDPGEDSEYLALKTKVIAGEIDVDEAIRQSVARFKAMAHMRDTELVETL